MHCAFIDFEKAFDSVWRIGLWQTLLSSNINGKCMPVSDLELYTMALNQNIVNVILVYDKEKMCHFFFIIFKRFTNMFSHRKHQRYRISNKDNRERY